MNHKPLWVKTILILGVLLIVPLLFILASPKIVHWAGWETKPSGAIALDLPSLATPLPAESLAVTPTEVSSNPATESSANTSNTPQPSEAPATEPAKANLQARLEGDKATLTFVLSNPGNDARQVCFIIPAIFNADNKMVRVVSFDLVTPGTSNLNKIDSYARCGINPASQPMVAAISAESIPPHSASSFELTFTFPKDNSGPGPYTGQVVVYDVTIFLTATATPGGAESLSSKPGIEPLASIPFTIEDGKPGTVQAAWTTSKSNIVPFLTALLECLAVLLGVIVLYKLLPLVGNAIGRPGMLIEEIASGESADLGKQLSALLQDELDRFRRPGRGQNQSLTLIFSPPEDKPFSVSSKLQETAQIQIIIEVLEFIFKRNVIKIAGYTQRSCLKGAGLTLNIVDNRNGSIVDTQTFWELDYSGIDTLVEFPQKGNAEQEANDIDPYFILVQPAASWIAFKTSDYLGQSYAPLGTESWLSHALTLQAMHFFGLIGYQTAPKDARHRTIDLLSKALNEDPRNPVANINLARLESEEDPRFGLMNAEERLKIALDSLAGNEKVNDPLIKYTAELNLATVESLSALAKEKPDKPIKNNPKRKEAQSRLNQLEQNIQAASNKKGKSRIDDVLLNDYLNSVECLRGMINLDEHKEPNLDFDKKKMKGIGLVNLQPARPGNEEQSTLLLNFRVQYNLACYYSISLKRVSKQAANEYAEKAFRYLAGALELPGDLRNYALKDSDLLNLRTYDRVRFAEIADVTEEEMEMLSTTAVTLAEILDLLRKQADVNSLETLIKKGATPEQRRSLEKKCDGKLSYAQITKWVRIADLMRLQNVGEGTAKLLYQAKVVSPQKLKEQNAANLHKKIVGINSEYKFIKRVPSEAELQEWIQEAAAPGFKDLVD